MLVLPLMPESVGTTENHQQNFPERAAADIIIGFNECWERKESAI